jgi:hypothetical protein
MTNLRRMTEAVSHADNGGCLVGNQPLGEVAQEWLDVGFDADTAPEWWAAGVWDADAAAALRDSGLNADRNAGELILSWVKP